MYFQVPLFLKGVHGLRLLILPAVTQNNFAVFVENN